MLKEKVYWHDTVEMPSGHEINPLPEKVDVAVVRALHQYDDLFFANQDNN